jgi:hypothetical protein
VFRINTSKVKSVEPASKHYNNLEDAAQDSEQTQHSRKSGEKQTVSQLEQNHRGITPPMKGLETVTLKLANYEQLRRDQEELHQLKNILNQMIDYSSSRIRINKEIVKQYVMLEAQNSNLSHDMEEDGSDIDFY